jgi:LysR substrate binding domain
MLKNYYAGDTSNQEGTKDSRPSVPKIAQDWGQDEADHDCNPLDMSMLPADELVSLQVGHVIQWMFGVELEEQPTNMRVEKFLRYAVRIIVMIDMLTMPTVFARPRQSRVLEGRCSQNENKAVIKLKELKPLFFIGMSEANYPGYRRWLKQTCRRVGFSPKVLQDVEIKRTLIQAVAAKLGVALLPDQVKKLPHGNVIFRPQMARVMTESCIAWRSILPL